VKVTPCNDCATLHIWEGARYRGGEVALTLSDEQVEQIEAAIREYREQKKTTAATVASGMGSAGDTSHRQYTAGGGVETTPKEVSMR